MADERLADLLARLEQERDAADRRYNDALTTLDRSLAAGGSVPAAPPAYDESKLGAINDTWNILPQGAPPIDGSLKGRLRGFIWRLVGPPLDAQRAFNAAVVDHFNRNVAAHRESRPAIEALLAALAAEQEQLRRFQAHLIQFLQTVTLYVDTKDRSVGGQIQVLNAGLSAMADDWLKRWESAAAPASRLNAAVATLGDVHRALDEMRATVALAQQTSITLKREVERIVTAPGANGSGQEASPAVQAADVNAFKYLGFEDEFRGRREDIRARLAEYVPKFEGRADILDIGCGRGEFLDLLRERGISARGLDVNREMVETSRARGLSVEQADALGYLRRLPDESLGGIFSAQVIEHLAPDYLMALLDAAALKLRSGGLIVLETINPACWLAFFESYIRDLTHVRPIHPDTLQYLLRASGFQSVTIEYRSPVDPESKLRPAMWPAGEGDPRLQDLAEAFNANVEVLNGRLFTFQDYAAIARK